MRLFKQKKGMTLLEIIIAIAILGVLLSSFLAMFTSGFSQIFKMGGKTSAVADAQNIIDAVYIARDSTDLFIQGLDTEEYKKTDCGQIETELYSSHRVIYCVGSEIIVHGGEGKAFDKVTVKVFYRNGNESVTLSVIVP